MNTQLKKIVGVALIIFAIGVAYFALFGGELVLPTDRTPLPPSGSPVKEIGVQGSCTPAPGYEYCWEGVYNNAEVRVSVSYYGPNSNKIKFTTDNTGKQIPYILSGQSFKIEYHVDSSREWAWDGDDGTRTYYKQEGGDLDCTWDTGCDGQSLSWEQGNKYQSQTGNQYVWVGTLGSHVQTFGNWASTWHYGWEPGYIYGSEVRNIHIIQCGEDADCSSDSVCDKTSNDPFAWNCQALSCDDGNICTTDVASNHVCTNTLIPDCCLQDIECSFGELCISNECMSPPPPPIEMDWTFIWGLIP